MNSIEDIQKDFDELKRKDKAEFAAWAVGTVIGLMMGAIICLMIFTEYTHNKAIEYNCAQYNTQTGEFMWKEVE